MSAFELKYDGSVLNKDKHAMVERFIYGPKGAKSARDRAIIEIDATDAVAFATVRFRNQEKDFEAKLGSEALAKAMTWVEDAPELATWRR